MLVMPKIRARSRPLVPCAFELCNTSFRKWRKRLYCSDRCRKEAWRFAHKPYYAKVKREQRLRDQAARRKDLRYHWVVEGKENEAPERLTLVEAVAQASPEVIKDIKKLLPDYEEAQDDRS